MVIVIDAYDERQDEALAKEALLLLFETVPKDFPNIKILITSRPEQHIKTIVEGHSSVAKSSSSAPSSMLRTTSASFCGSCSSISP